MHGCEICWVVLDEPPVNWTQLVHSSVGTKYITPLGHRGFIKKTTSLKSDLYFEWNNPSGATRFTDIFYTSTDGTEKTVRVERVDTETRIDDYKQGTVFRQVTYYSPDNLWLDTIKTGIRIERELTVDKKIGKVIAYSTQTSGDEATKFYDGETGTVWQTNGSYPEYITIDLGADVPAVTGFGIVPSIKYTYATTGSKADPRAPTKVRFEASLDSVLWTNVGEYAYDNGLVYGERLFELEQTVNARYIRFTGVECTSVPLYSGGIGGPNTVKMVLAELNVNIKLED